MPFSAFTQSKIFPFDPYYEYDITPFQAYHIAKKVCKIFADAQYQVIFSIHENNSHLHIHILVNTIDLTNGMLYNCDMHNFYAIRGHVKFCSTIIPSMVWESSFTLIRIISIYIKSSLRASYPEGHPHSF